MCTFKTDRGKQGVSLNGFRYRFDKKGADGFLYWRCIDLRHCKGRLRTDDVDPPSNPQERGEHSHLPNEELTAVRRVKTNIRKRATDETTPLPTIYRQETRGMDITKLLQIIVQLCIP
jgi:FLYWCH zinc finger domain